MKFNELVNESLEQLEYDDTYFDEYVFELYSDDINALSEDLQCPIEEAELFFEEVKKRVTSTGNVSRIRSAQYRQKRAALTTGLSKAARKIRAKKAARTRKRSPMSVKRAIRKRGKAMMRRKQMGIK
jgi:hypothetical protein